MDARNRRTLISNAVKSLLALLITNALGYLLYFFWSRHTGGAVVISFVVFLFSIYLFIRILTLPTNDERKISEREEIVKLSQECGYTLDFKEYFIKQLKYRLPAVFVVVFLAQIPLLINFAMVHTVEGFTVYTAPIPIYKFSTMGLFVFHLLGNAFWIAPILVTILFALFFVPSLYYYEKTFIPPKPSWV